MAKTRKSVTQIQNKVKNDTKKLTDYWSPRKSQRLIAKKQKNQDEENLRTKILSKIEEGLSVKIFPGKGRGVVANRVFRSGEYVVEYLGDLIDFSTAKKREKTYETDQKDCYLFFFEYKGRRYCIDSTEETERFGRLMNHSRLNPNCKTRLMVVGGLPRITMWTCKEVLEGDEFLFDYGDKSRIAVESFAWLANS